MFQTKFVSCSITFSHRGVNVMMWENIIESGISQMTYGACSLQAENLWI